jgi:hypothetical protein
MEVLERDTLSESKRTLRRSAGPARGAFGAVSVILASMAKVVRTPIGSPGSDDEKTASRVPRSPEADHLKQAQPLYRSLDAAIARAAI